MITLTPDECRVLGVLVEKAHTTATQYPLSLNAATAACNQKSNRHPIVHFDEERVYGVLESLRFKGLVICVSTSGSRVQKFKHEAREALGVGTKELVILTELMLRGPQTAGEIRTRASRMHELGPLEEVRNLLQYMTEGDEPSVRRLPPSPGSRAERYAQLLCPDLHPLDGPSADEPDAAEPAVDPGLVERVEQLEAELARLREFVRRLARSLGEPDEIPPPEAP